jgi:predicted hydrocarbon binding protein
MSAVEVRWVLIMREATDTIPLQDAIEVTQGALSRVALLHIAFSRVLVDEFGQERGKDLIAKAIIEYGHRIADRVRKGLPDLTELGLYDDKGEDGEFFSKGCAFAKVFEEEDALEVGHLYCYVDAAKTMALDEDAKMIHLTCQAAGDDVCTFDIIPTTEEERQAFKNRDGSWRAVDTLLYEYDE